MFKLKQFYLKQKVFSMTDRYKIYDDQQKELYEVRSKLLSITNKMEFTRISDGQVLFHFQKQLLHLMSTYTLMDGNHQKLATVKRKLAFVNKKVSVETSETTYQVEGNFTGHQFSIMNQGQEVANLRKKWISWGDAYEISVFQDDHAEFFLALVILLDSMFHEEGKNRN